MNINMTGSTEECLKHFAESHQSRLTANKCRIRNRISELLQIAPSSGYHWFTKLMMPSGVNLLKLQNFLELVGYEIQERRNLSIVQRNLAVLIAQMITSVADVAAYMNVAEHTVMRWCFGIVNPQARTTDSLSEFLELHKADYATKNTIWQSVLVELGFGTVKTEPQKQPDVKMITVAVATGLQPEIPTLSHAQIADSAAHLIMALKPLVEIVLSDGFPLEEREKVRDKTQVVRSSGVFDLANMLNQLCSERARKDLKKPETK